MGMEYLIGPMLIAGIIFIIITLRAVRLAFELTPHFGLRK